MTAGGHNGRGYGRDDEAYPSRYPAYPAYPAHPAHPPEPEYLPDPAYPPAPRHRPVPASPAPTYPGSDRHPGSDRLGGAPPAEGYRTPSRQGPPRNSRSQPPDGHATAERRSPPGRPAPASADVDDDQYGRKQRDKRRRLPLWQELPLLLIIAFCLAVLIRTFLMQAFYIPSGSMEDTLLVGDRVLVNKVVYNFRDPARGEVVVFKGTDAWAPLASGDDDVGIFARVGRTLGDLVGISRPGEKDFIKRVVGVPGDVVSCCDGEGRVFVNGEAVDETYVVRDSPMLDTEDGVRDCQGRQFAEVVVEPGQVFVMGDHRQRSKDSRCQGQVPIENVIGRAFLIVWPNDRWGGLSETETFAGVPPPAVAAADAAGNDPAGDGPAAADPVAAGDPAATAGLVLPVLLPLPAAVARRRGVSALPPARFRFAERDQRRRLAE